MSSFVGSNGNQLRRAYDSCNDITLCDGSRMNRNTQFRKSWNRLRSNGVIEGSCFIKLLKQFSNGYTVWDCMFCNCVITFLVDSRHIWTRSTSSFPSVWFIISWWEKIIFFSNRSKFFCENCFIYLTWKMICFSFIIMFLCHYPKGLGSVRNKNLTSCISAWSPSKVPQNFESYSTGQWVEFVKGGFVHHQQTPCHPYGQT